jgi:hypothetical protein
MRSRSVTSILAPAIALLVLVVASAPSPASEAGLSGDEGHPRERFPLAVYVAPLGEPALDAAVRGAVTDWNTMFEDAFGARAFTDVASPAQAQVVVTFEPRPSPRMMGETHLSVDHARVITPPVRIVVFQPEARGQTAREVLLYQVVAHELGHALGLTHARDPRSVMCCPRGSVDFSDPAQREAYLEGRRHPDLRSVRDQLEQHYERFWKRS